MGILWCILLYGGVLVSCEEVGVNLISGIKNSVTTSQSSIVDNNKASYDSPNAIDGKASQLIDSCGCCSVTKRDKPSWWQINLGKKYLIDALEVFGRETGEPQRLQYADIYAGNVSLAGGNTNGVKVYTIPTITDYNSHFIKYLQPAIIAQYFKIILNDRILNICEFKLYEKHCGVGRFGTGCSHQCHCLDEDTCNSVTGRCQTTGCLDGWQGLACDTRVNLISGIKNSVTTSQSSLFNNYDSPNAIDGIDSQLIDSCGCCSVTNGSTPLSWWQINLGNKYLIDAVEVFGRKADQPQQLQDAVIYAGNVSLAGNNTNGVVVYTIPTITNDTSHFIEYLQHVIIAQYFIIKLQQKILTICEFKLYEKFCDVGRFGAGCSHQCHCSDQQSCNSVTGICQKPGCLDGWQGLACDQICGHGTFGYNCSSECHCKDDADCELTTGFCSDGCAPGWRGQSCDTVCDHGTFGFNCLRGCHCKYGAECDLQTGYCSDGCAPGWQGPSCDIDTNLIRLVYGKVTTQMSSVAHSWSSDLAIDGREGPDPTKCQCCSATTNAEMSWWRLDLGSIFPIKAVTIYGSNQEIIYQTLQGFQMYLSNNTDHNLPAVYIDNISIPVDNTYIITLPDTLARYVTIRRPGVLTLCEITLLEGERIGIGNTEQKGTCDTRENETGSDINVTSAIIGASVGVAVSLACAISIGIIVWKYRTSKRTESKNEYTRPAHSSAPSEVPVYDTLDDRQDTSTPRSNVYINESVTGL